MQDSPSNKPAVTAEFTAAHRLLRKDRFDHVIRGENISDRYFKVFYVGNGKENSKLGIIASKKSFPKAVDRNRVKRLVRETFRRHCIKTLKLDLVVSVRTAVIRETGVGTEKLNMLFDRIEDKCAES